MIEQVNAFKGEIPEDYIIVETDIETIYYFKVNDIYNMLNSTAVRDVANRLGRRVQTRFLPSELFEQVRQEVEYLGT